MFQTVLIANRGEIAVRIARTLRRLGIRSVAVHSDADAGARHVREADEAVRVSGYLDIAAVVEAARRSGAQAVHPGYGFLAENTAFARACAEAGLVFVGPPAGAIEAMGDKIRAKRTVAAAGVPVVPGRDEPGLSDAELAEAALEVGLPVLLKPSAGGGGKGMRLVRDPAELAGAIEAARREARGAFGDDTLLVERFVTNPRHIEIQVFADSHGNVVHLGERECSLQRRHQKIVEEAPSPLLDAARRERMGATACAAARAVGYVGAGTVEYIVSADRPDEYFFMEMNTRLQVEHPVTELVTGLDLVELQLRIAAGEPLPFAQDDVRMNGHAIEARVYAEDPARGFLPTGGRVLALDEPETRVDSGISEGDEVGSSYDPMLAKVIAWGEDRGAALRRLDRALASYTLLGVPSNIAFLRALLAHPDVVSGRLDTGLVERSLDDLIAEDVPAEVLAAAALERTLALETGDTDPWAIPDGWRLGGVPAWTSWIITPSGGRPVEVRVRGRAANAEVLIEGEETSGSATADGAAPVPAALSRDGGRLRLSYGGRTTSFAYARDGEVLWLGRDGRVWALAEHVRGEEAGAGAGGAGDGVLRSPMPGTVIAVKAAEGDRVTEGQPLVVVEAMKMEHTVTAPMDGVVSRIAVRPGAGVALDAVLAEITPQEAGS
ncbi:acetyl/propionyl/methylcrotonyl-CoA carboxylase subunit alpha [Thermomonospora cellulosilytica]|uniref:Biotin-dependent 3-methylcrotonyl-coenzyme A carboxylase alpha1 subunit n=1 Tax=Thermomonospora cellulosilytica TaxID=1411118 RepID=A0A7W3MZR1_9ACTN|nr:acetyl/propionyl/methylcrotonyl-CoA carboxylase subunit alpha [Thermomonospora cellulosilytica]MBA9004881.1 acetyl-CoA/propionyl-CoA carboxylase biotin carboxyl carrier protein [Thermomonospora cellulosilytica]